MPLDLSIEGCRTRQRRLLDVLHERQLAAAIVVRPEHVQWLCGPRFRWYFEPAAVLFADGHCLLVAPNRPPEWSAADEVHTYEAQWVSTLRNDQRAASSQVLLAALADRQPLERVGVEFATLGPCLGQHLRGELVDLDADLYRLRRRKEADELAMLKRAIDATSAMYRCAARIVRPGLNELEMFNQLQAAAVETFGEMLTATGNDYAAGERGGPPRDRAIEAGELYILDLGPAYRGYFADNCRTLAVDGRPTPAQRAAAEHIAGVFPQIESLVRPGVSCAAIYDQIKTYMDDYAPGKGSFTHHLGHGIGLNPHEAPHLNPRWDDVFEEGDIFTVEPGLYTPQLRAGIRIENDYRVTADGVELLTDLPLELDLEAWS